MDIYIYASFFTKSFDSLFLDSSFRSRVKPSAGQRMWTTKKTPSSSATNQGSQSDCWLLLAHGWLRIMYQGTRTGVPLRYVYQCYFLCSTLGFLGILTHKYPRDIGLILRDFPFRGPTLGSGAHILAYPLNVKPHKLLIVTTPKLDSQSIQSMSKIFDSNHVPLIEKKEAQNEGSWFFSIFRKPCDIGGAIWSQV